MTVTLLLVGTAFVTAIVSAAGKCPLWVPVVLLCVAGLLAALPR